MLQQPIKLAVVLSSLLAITLAQQQHQQHQQQQSASSDNKQVRLEDIERDTLTNAQQRQNQQQQQSSQQQPTQQYGTLAQQQIAAYQQQQYLLQQLQQQQPYFPQALGAYPNPYSALPLMILPGNQLGVGPVGPVGHAPALPLQYFLPDASFLYQQPAPAGANPAAAFTNPLLASSPIYQVSLVLYHL
ncbi:general transcriptional corepressor trfA-like [Nilaparvata lugens]|uniref:general transcriptional corepressor trfA-like n=1 Tax=Nilaparvata lugens TaxID=108931 RepID=UPI00193CAF9D|nr:general transcriptional corepressor trfA-like [Nilaparvata lugens]